MSQAERNVLCLMLLPLVLGLIGLHFFRSVYLREIREAATVQPEDIGQRIENSPGGPEYWRGELRRRWPEITAKWTGREIPFEMVLPLARPVPFK